MHPGYQAIIEKAERSHEHNRNPEGIDEDDVALARLYCYAFRAHTIGTFHAARLALAARPQPGPLAMAWRIRAMESLSDMANQAMELVPRDFRALIAVLYRYHRGVGRVVDSLQRDWLESRDAEIDTVAGRFRQIVERITACCGIHLTQDTGADSLASFIVPNLGISIVPLVYGDYHSWNLAYLGGEHRDVPTHLHQQGVEIHLGFNPAHGMTVLGGHRAEVDEGYAMPVPPRTDHGWVNTSGEVHHVPFIFGSRKLGGWGVFLDVVAQKRPVSELALVPRDSQPFSQMVYLERAIAAAEKSQASRRQTLIPFSVTNREGTGGLELCLTRVNPSGFRFPIDEFCAVGVVRGEGVVNVAGVEQTVRQHDHFGVPAGLSASIRQSGGQPLVVLDATIRGFGKPGS